MSDVVQITDYDWIDVTDENEIQCCDCGLVHRIGFQIIDGMKGERIVRQVVRDDRETSKQRRAMKRKKEGIFA